jgi:hypothetical protein
VVGEEGIIKIGQAFILVMASPSPLCFTLHQSKKENPSKGVPLLLNLVPKSAAKLLFTQNTLFCVFSLNAVCQP